MSTAIPAKDNARACPFCGDAAAPGIVESYADSGAVFVWCDTNYGGCGARAGIHSTSDAAIMAWNRRHGEGSAP